MMRKMLTPLLLLIVWLLLLCACRSGPPDSLDSSQDTVQSPATILSPDTIIPEEDTKISVLPDISEVSPDTQPLLYDFLAGCLDWHISIHRDTIDSDLYILRHSSSPEILYTDWYAVQGGYTVPPTGTGIESTTLHQRDVVKFDTIVDTIPDSYKVVDGDWELIIYAGEAATALNQLGMTFRDTYKYAEACQPPFIAEGTGWPSEWLRREPYATRLASESEIDMQDAWWDTFRLQGRYDLIQKGDTGELHTYYAICTGVMQFSFCDDEGNTARGMSWDLLRESCNVMQSDIEGIYQWGTWYPDSE